MATNDSGYELHIGPDNTGRYLSVQPGEDYDPPKPAEQLEDSKPDPEEGDDGEPEPDPPNSADVTGGTGQQADPNTAPPASSGTTPPSQTAEPNGDDQKDETTP